MRASVCFVLAVVWVGAVAAQSTSPPAPAQDPAQPIQYRESVEVVGVTPIHGLGVSRDKVPANVQTATAADIARTPGVHMGDVLANGFASVNINEAQANPFQPDIQFRGFGASPLLGLPQGIAVYQDGVRVNEPFGDTVNWDLLPTSAIASVNLMPGSNPLFGLNALGGALSVETKSGFTHPGHVASVFAGSFGRVWTDLQSAGHNDRLSYFVTGRLLAEDGWRDFSESRVRQLFGSVQWRRSAATLFGASVTAGGNKLIGNGPAPVQLLEESRGAIFTHPDVTETALGLVTLTGRHTASPTTTFDGVLFYRPATVRTFNGDDSIYEGCDEPSIAHLMCVEDDDDPILDQYGQVVPVADPEYDATNNTSKTKTQGWGAGFQATMTRPLAARANTLITGASFDGAGSRYESDTELARLTDTRGTEGVGILDAGAAVGLRTTVRHAGAYAADFFTPTPRVTIAASARLAYSTIALRDQLGDELTGDHSYARVNPSLGATFQLPRGSSAYGSFSVSSRVPSPSELSCADPEAPCRLPNAFLSDPPLEQVVARTLEGGLRGRAGQTSWNAGVFRTANRDDIVFVSSGALTNQGHFANVGDTLRRGLEIGASGRLSSRLAWSGAYTYLRATFETPLMLASPNHPDAMDGEIVVPAGSSIPGVPRHNTKGGLVFSQGAVALGATVVAMSEQFLRGDESNQLEPVSGFATVDLSASYALGRRVKVSARLSNLFDADVETFGLLGDPSDVLGDAYDDPRFLSPGAPRAAWVGVEIGIP